MRRGKNQAVRDEINSLKNNLTQEEKDRLDPETVNCYKTDACIYAQASGMTVIGGAYSKEATALKGRIMNVTFVEDLHTPLESYFINQAEWDFDSRVIQAHIVKYIKGDVKRLRTLK